MKVRLTMTGTTPLLLHNVQLASPLNPFAKKLKALNSKRNKTDEDRLEVARVEWEASWYWDEEQGPVLPTANIRRCLIDGARLTKSGKKVERGVTPLDYQVALNYSGPRDLDALWGKGVDGSPYVDLRPVVVMRSKVDRCRPKLGSGWSCVSDWLVDTTVIEADEFESIADTAGATQGVGDFRLSFGRFEATVQEI